MASADLEPRSRRAMLTAAAGVAGALAASAAMPLAAAAAPTSLQTEQDNVTVATTSVTQVTNAQVAFKARATLTGAAGLVGISGDEADIAASTAFTGVYGWAPHGGVTDVGAGVWGDSVDIGVYGTGDVGVQGYGSIGVYGSGSTGVSGESLSSTEPGVLATGASASSLALKVVGKVKFNRSGRAAMSSGARSKVVTLAGTTSTSKVFAVLATNEAGRWVRAVVAAAGKFTIHLNTTLTSSAVVSWFVLD